MAAQSDSSRRQSAHGHGHKAENMLDQAANLGFPTVVLFLLGGQRRAETFKINYLQPFQRIAQFDQSFKLCFFRDRLIRMIFLL